MAAILIIGCTIMIGLSEWHDRKEIECRNTELHEMISDTKETYYEALQESSCNWHEGTNDYAPFVTYMLGILAAAYRDFESRIELLTTKGLSKPDRVREIIRNHLGKITKSEIMAKCPDISQITVQRALAELLKSCLLYTSRCV